MAIEQLHIALSFTGSNPILKITGEAEAIGAMMANATAFTDLFGSCAVTAKALFAEQHRQIPTDETVSVRAWVGDNQMVVLSPDPRDPNDELLVHLHVGARGPSKIRYSLFPYHHQDGSAWIIPYYDPQDRKSVV